MLPLSPSVTGILHLANKTLTYTKGGYENFNRMRKIRTEQDQKAAQKLDHKRAHLQNFVDRFRYKASKARQAQSKLKILEKLDPIALPEAEQTVSFQFELTEELSPPIFQIEGGSVGYDGSAVLKGLNLRIDQDDKIGLLGLNGQGKTTLLKLIVGDLTALSGDLKAHRNLRIGYFAQHQIDSLELSETPLDILSRKLAGREPKEVRAKLAQFGLFQEQAELEVSQLSGGQKAKLSLLLATLNHPHLLILDEPSNHLDMESREALAHALALYNGAVLLVSHDRQLLGSVVDRLWLVKDGAVKPLEADIETYRDAILETAPKADAKTKRIPKQSKADIRSMLAPLKTEVSQCESRLAKLAEMQEKINSEMADSDLYLPQNKDRYEFLQKKQNELKLAMKKADSLWIEAMERLELKESELRNP